MIIWVIPSPVGMLELCESDDKLVAVRFGNEVASYGDPPSKLLKETTRQLNAYFAGKLKEFDLPLNPKGTPFQQTVWEQVGRIPFGSLTTYGELAAGIGNPRLARAVGQANAKNPIPVIIPCHRVVGHNAHLTGYAGGIDRKAWLLKHEGALYRDRLF
ncbi:MAG: methylated-DNA--[protein]-cysteine S-methyltransferase [Bacteroidales bacterium]